LRNDWYRSIRLFEIYTAVYTFYQNTAFSQWTYMFSEYLKHGVKCSDMPGIPRRKEGDCTVSGVVYLISCQACGEEYIGKTGRPLYVRIKEHLNGKEKLRASTALGYHRINSHGGEDFGVEALKKAIQPKR
uniref:GIY-YIG domain-containing protein n=1 Tax=Heligmosomoides polygyrus TaxID=6339 RepID=A0A183GHQ8_HELPZ